MTTEKAFMRKAGLRGIVASLLALFVVATGAEAQMVTPAPEQTRPIALTGGTIHTVSQGVIENGTIVFDNGVITAVGSNVQIPGNAERIDISGQHVYPGLIDGYSAMGLYEIGSVDVTVDLSELGSINPNARAHVAVNPETRHIGTTRSNGVLVTVTSPSGGLVSGLAAAMQLEGWSWEEMTLQPEVGLIVNWPNPGGGFRGFGFGGGGNQDPEQRYADQIQELRDVFATARAYRQAQRAAESGDAAAHDSDSRWEAMIPVLDGDVPVIVDADDIRQIQDAVTWAEEEGVRIIIRGGTDAPYVAEYLAEKNIPVFVTSVLDSPSRDWEPYDNHYSLPARLHEAGVPFAITGGSSAPYANRLPYEAGTAVAYGLPEDEALRAVTLSPARFLGIDDRVGSLEAGKHATLFISTGSPLEYSTTVEQVFIQGRRVDMMDVHKQFFQKYQEKVRQLVRPRT